VCSSDLRHLREGGDPGYGSVWLYDSASFGPFLDSRLRENDLYILRFGISCRDHICLPFPFLSVIPAAEPESRKRLVKHKWYCPVLSLHRFTSSFAALVSDQFRNDALLRCTA